MNITKQYDYLLVGAGLFNSTFAYLAAQHGKRCIVIDKRKNIGGNLYCENVEGINVHKYGPHIFHTSNRKVWNLVTSLTSFNHFINCSIARSGGKIYNLPFNMNTFYQLWGTTNPQEAEGELNRQRKEVIRKMNADGVTQPRNLEEQALLLAGSDIYEMLIKGYTEKQWGRQCCELPSFIIQRLPFRLTFDNNYFSDLYQGVSIGGYNLLIQRLLKDADVWLECDYNKCRGELNDLAETIVYSGAIDEYFNYAYGRLEYRSLIFKEEILNIPNYQGNAIVNYTDRSIPFTRIVEHKHFEHLNADIYTNHKTVITKEFSCEHTAGMEPYYPINDTKNNRLYAQYKEMASQEKNVIFGGRLAEYKYYDMDKTIERAFTYWKE